MTSPHDSASQLTTLLAIIRAARLTGDRDLERETKRQLADRFGMRLTFLAGERKAVAR